MIGKRGRTTFYLSILFILVHCQKDVLKWCTTNVNEQEKCEEMAHNVDLQFSQFGKLGMVVKCIRVRNQIFLFLFVFLIFLINQ
jgi:hypothetical protein